MEAWAHPTSRCPRMRSIVQKPLWRQLLLLLLIVPAAAVAQHKPGEIVVERGTVRDEQGKTVPYEIGTLYVPGKEREKLSFGVEPDRYPAHTITGELVAPFLRAFAIIRLPKFILRAKSWTKFWIWRRARSA